MRRDRLSVAPNSKIASASILPGVVDAIGGHLAHENLQTGHSAVRAPGRQDFGRLRVRSGGGKAGLRRCEGAGEYRRMSIRELIAGLPAPKPLRLGETALFLDLDGTLAPIAARPQDVGPDPRRTSLLERLALKLDGRLAVVSGRTLADVDRILEGCVTAVAAVPGLVLREPAGGLHASPPPPALPLPP